MADNNDILDELLVEEKEPKYFAAKSAKDTAGILLNRAEDWFNNMRINGYLDKLKQMYASYHGAYYDTMSGSHNIVFSGEQGELSNIAINHLRNLAQNMLTLITSNRPALEAKAINTDYKSVTQTTLANGLLDYYVREKRLENYFKTAVEYALVLGTGYVKMEWNATSGDMYDFNEATNTEIREGDVEFSNLSPFDVVFDGHREDNNHSWVLCRTFKNKHDIIAQYPEFTTQIEALPTKDELEAPIFSSVSIDETDLIPIYEFYHKRTSSMPDGRYLLFLDETIQLIDAPMPYRELPVYAIQPSRYMGTPYGYSPLFDILGIQDAVNSAYSTVLTNQSTFGVQNITVPQGSNVNVEQLSGGLNIIEYDQTNNGKIEALNLTATPKEVFDFMGKLESIMETLSGVSAVTRGNVQNTNLTSGTALALVQSMSLQFMSGLQQSYIQMLESTGTGLINMLKDFASVPRVAMIVGKTNRPYMKEFTGDDLSSVNRVIVDVANPLSRCLAKDTEVLMFDGSLKKVQDIKKYDLVMGPDSKPRTVINTASGKEMMYRVTSKDKHRGIDYTVNKSHILTLKFCSDDKSAQNRYKKGDILDLSVDEYFKIDNYHRHLLQGFTTGVEFEPKAQTIPSYILGLWLGDGHSATTGLTTADNELVEEWSNYAKSIGMSIRVQNNRPPNKSKVYFITSGCANGRSDRNPMMNELRRMDLIKNKHIPQNYLTGSREQRLELLAGLIDSDGNRSGETYFFTQKNKTLVDHVIYLSKSLGFRVTFKKFKSNSSKLTGTITGDCYKVTIGGNTWEIPSRLERKQCRPKEKARDWLNYGIKVEEVGIDNFYGFTLREEPHFVLGDFTVTHNTTAGRIQMADHLLQMGAIKTPEEYFTVINTGRLDAATEDTQREVFLVRAENERLVAGEEVRAMVTDEHALHIREHKFVLSDPELRFNNELAERVTAHIQEHIEMLRNTDADLLTMFGQQPLGPQGGTPANQQQPEMSSGVQQTPPNEMMQDPNVAQQMAAQDINIPQPATPPPPFDGSSQG